jgi:hypothetical protein
MEAKTVTIPTSKKNKIKIGRCVKTKKMVLLDENYNIIPFQYKLEIKSDVDEIPVMTVQFDLLTFEVIDIKTEYK